MTSLSRRRFLLGASAVAAAAVAKANIPPAILEPGAFIDGPQPSWVPEGWLYPDGRLLSRSLYPRLFAAIGTAYGNDGPTTFRLPDLRTRSELLTKENRLEHIVASDSEVIGARLAGEIAMIIVREP